MAIGPGPYPQLCNLESERLTFWRQKPFCHRGCTAVSAAAPGFSRGHVPDIHSLWEVPNSKVKTLLRVDDLVPQSGWT